MGNRLKELRESKGWTQDATADKFGVSKSQYVKLERGDRELTQRYIGIASRVFGVSNGAVTSGPELVPLMGYVGAGGEVSPEFEQVPPDGLEQIEIPFSLPGDMLALKVRGYSMLPRYDDGDVIIVWKEQRRPIEYFYGREAAVRTSAGRRYLKRIQRAAPGVDLISWNDAPIESVHLEWIGEIHMVLRADQITAYDPPQSKALPPRRVA